MVLPRRPGYSNPGLNHQYNGFHNGNPSSWSGDFGDRGGIPGIGSFQGASGRTATNCPPPLPPRPDQLTGRPVNRFTPYSGLSNYSSGYGYSYSPYSGGSPYYGGGGMYGGLGSYGSRLGYGNSDYYGYDGGGDNFIQMAEESSRPAFQSIESIVQAFGSVSMMLESTYAAVYSSFRAVIGVAEHFSHLRNHLAQIVSTLALVRTLRWLYRKALYLLGISWEDPSSEGAWKAANKAAKDSLEEMDLKADKSSWPILMFLSVVLGAPWLIWRVLSSVNKEKKPEKWMSGDDEHFVSFALFDFQGESVKELSFKAGQKVILAPKALQPRFRGWMLGSVDGKSSGLLPASYVRILGQRPAAQQQTDKVVEKPSLDVTELSSSSSSDKPKEPNEVLTEE